MPPKHYGYGSDYGSCSVSAFWEKNKIKKGFREKKTGKHRKQKRGNS
jgi:hypothetical protein